jgi:hypothetical protein
VWPVARFLDLSTALLPEAKYRLLFGPFFVKEFDWN